MENSFKFFQNKECKYFPCHKDVEELNCLFCYCPLYHMDECPGKWKIVEKNGHRFKSCIDCDFPHRPKNYAEVIRLLHNELKN